LQQFLPFLLLLLRFSRQNLSNLRLSLLLQAFRWQWLCCQQGLCPQLPLLPCLLPFLLQDQQFCLLLHWPLQRAGRQARVSLALQEPLLQGHSKLLQMALLLLVLAAVGAVRGPVQLQVPAVLGRQLCWGELTAGVAAIAVQEQLVC
jgi:hypothetical protein